MSDTDWDGIAKSYWDAQPHPHDPSGKLKIGEFATAVKLATMAKFGGHASPHEATLFWEEFAPGGVPIMAPEEFEQALDRLAPVSFVFHGRPPTMKEIAALKDKQPHETRKYFTDLPDKHHPEVTAGEMVKAVQIAAPWARQHLGREPVKPEAAYLHFSGEKPDTYYANLAAQEAPTSDTLTEPLNVLPTQNGPNDGGRGVGAPGGPPPRK